MDRHAKSIHRILGACKDVACGIDIPACRRIYTESVAAAVRQLLAALINRQDCLVAVILYIRNLNLAELSVQAAAVVQLYASLLNSCHIGAILKGYSYCADLLSIEIRDGYGVNALYLLLKSLLVQLGFLLRQNPVHHALVAIRVVLAVYQIQILAQAVLGVGVSTIVTVIVVNRIPLVSGLDGGMSAGLIHIRIELLREMRDAQVILQPCFRLAALFIQVPESRVHRLRYYGRGDEIIVALEEPYRYILGCRELHDLLVHLHAAFPLGQVGAVAAVLNHDRSDVIRTVTEQSRGTTSALGSTGHIDTITVYCEVRQRIAECRTHRVISLVTVLTGLVAAVVLRRNHDHILITIVSCLGPHGSRRIHCKVNADIVDLGSVRRFLHGHTLTGAVRIYE